MNLLIVAGLDFDTNVELDDGIRSRGGLQLRLGFGA
jgi:hypothetical protein